MYYLDIAYDSLVKQGEELCGDHVEMVHLKDSTILVLSDGLGSGVKANILATLTAKIAATMLQKGSSLEETIETIVHTLPECHVRKLAYSTFTIIKVYKDGKIYVAEFDNPSFMLFNKNNYLEIPKTKQVIQNKTIYESHFTMDENKTFITISDGIVHAGVGKRLDLGWQWDNVRRFIQTMKKSSSNYIVEEVLKICSHLYNDEIGDDSTILVIRAKQENVVNIFIGPPKDASKDKDYVQEFMSQGGKKIVCGGTTANIFSKINQTEIEVDLDTLTRELPPLAHMQGLDLVTEGIITIKKVTDLINQFCQNNRKFTSAFYENNAAAKLAHILLEEGSFIHIWLGTAINSAHQNPDFPTDFNIKSNQVKHLVSELKQAGKEVNLRYL